jgi:hypothetical protein
MAVLNFSITIPDNQQTRVATAVKAYLGNPALTNAEAIEGLRQEFIVRLKNIVAAVERKAALDAAEAANYDVSAT